MKEAPYYDVGQMVIHKSNQILALNKPAGLAMQGKTKPDLCQLANAFAQRKLFVLHRIDQPASGVVLFGRNKHTATHVSEQFANNDIERTYLAVVKNRPPKDQDTISQILQSNKKLNKVFIVEEENESAGTKWAELSYTYLVSSDNYHLLQIKLYTGRHHQIRAQLADIGSPIKGDVKYGDRRSNRDRSIHLHAYSVVFTHPISNESLQITAPLPDEPLWQFFREKLV